MSAPIRFREECRLRAPPRQSGALQSRARAPDILGTGIKERPRESGRGRMDVDCVNVEYWTKLEDGRIECRLCPRFCHMRPGQRGLCFVRRAREDGEGMELTGYGRSTGFCIDPIEKKPLNHFLPGSSVLSFGTAGCNLACAFCQNWDISKSREVGAPQRDRACRRRSRAPPSGWGAPASPTPTTIRSSSWNTRSTRPAACRAQGRQERRRHRGLRLRGAAQAPLRRHGRGERRPQGLHRALLREALRRLAQARCSRR